MTSQLRRCIGDLEYRAWAHWCAGCDGVHTITVASPYVGPVWDFDGDLERPTFSPSVRITYNGRDAGEGDAPPANCHYNITAGKVIFHGDSTHALSGQTVELPQWPYAAGEYGGVE